MTEAEWRMAPFAEQQTAVSVLGRRRHRLFAVAACRALGRWADHPAITSALRVAENYADSEGTTVDLRRAWQHLRAAREEAEATSRGWREWRQVNAFGCAAAAVSDANAVGALLIATSSLTSLDRSPEDILYPLYADLAGPTALTFAPAWRTPTATAIAAGAYADRAFDRLPILADALEDAGCDAAELLAHLRGPGPHARGCWALDAVLSKT